MVKKNNIGNDVIFIQNVLNSIGFKVGNVDGVFGPNTERGVRQFQNTFGLKVDGIVGKETFVILNKANNVRHFTVDEFRCRHCGSVKLDINLLLKLEELRKSVGNRPITINSGYRCPVHNRKVNGAVNSQHLYGKAADISLKDITMKILAAKVNEVFAKGGVGYYSSFVHVDVRGYRARWNSF